MMWKKSKHFLPQEILLFSKQKIGMMTWLTNIMNTLVQVKAKFWRLKQNWHLNQNMYKPKLPISNFEQLTNWF